MLVILNQVFPIASLYLSVCDKACNGWASSSLLKSSSCTCAYKLLVTPNNAISNQIHTTFRAVVLNCVIMNFVFKFNKCVKNLFILYYSQYENEGAPFLHTLAFI